MLIFLLAIAFLSQLHTITCEKFAQEGDFPFEVAIMDRGKFICGGALVSVDHVVTAAHCLVSRVPGDLAVLTGTADRAKFYNENMNAVREVILHPQYTPSTMDFDIALVKLRNPIQLTTYADVIDMVPPDYEIGDDSMGTIIHWDHLQGTRLSYTDIEIWHADKCTSVNIWGEYGFNLEVPLVSENSICASIPIGACIANDAGSLIVNGKLLGIVSWNDVCESRDKPLVLSNMANFEEWIKRVQKNL